LHRIFRSDVSELASFVPDAISRSASTDATTLQRSPLLSFYTELEMRVECDAEKLKPDRRRFSRALR
jgi:hypothetical protein